MRLLSLLVLLLWCPTAFAAIYAAPPKTSSLIGFPMEYRVNEGQSLDDIAKANDMGLLALLAANPGIDPYLPPTNNLVELPSQMLLPDAPRKGVVINLAELRLYFFDNANKQVHVFPIGIGRIGRETPLTATRISHKIKDPSWRPTMATRKEWLEEKGEELPQVVPAGPDNPLGHRALRLGFSRGEYLIHGTNKDFGIGLRVSAGCIRLRPKDIETLYELVRVGEPVRIVHQPVKVAQEPTGLFMEVHEPLSQREQQEKYDKTIELTKQQQQWISADGVNRSRVENLLLEQRGVPFQIN